LSKYIRTSATSAGTDPNAPSMSIPNVAAYLGVDVSTVRSAIEDGRLKAYALGPRVIRLRRSEVDPALEDSSTQITNCRQR
jgi:excisionase family DNA binding protein